FPTIPTVVSHPELRPCGQTPLATEKVRYVGEPMVAVVAEDRYAAEDGAAAVMVEDEPLDPGPNAQRATAPGAARLHEPLRDNLAAAVGVGGGAPDGALRSGEVVTRGRYYVHRHTGMPLETRGVVAHWNAGSHQLTLWSSTQWPHTLRNALREVLGLAEHHV